MIEDREIWGCAQLMRQHGSEAWYVAAQRADALLAQGEMEGHCTFLRILARIEQLEQMTPGDVAH